MPSMQWQYIEHLRMMVLAHDETPPTDEEWDPYASELEAAYHEGKLRRVLVLTDGGGPNASQRQRLHHDQHPVNIAVVTHSIVARGIVTALSWFYEIRAFAPADLDSALTYLAVPHIDWMATRKTVASLRMQLTNATHRVEPFALNETIDKLDELVTDRLPRLRERVQDAKHASDGAAQPPRHSRPPPGSGRAT